MIYTPGGRKIKLRSDYCSALMGRVYPWVHPLDVLRLTDSVNAFPYVLAMGVMMVLFAFDLGPLPIVMIGYACYILAVFLNLTGSLSYMLASLPIDFYKLKMFFLIFTCIVSAVTSGLYALICVLVVTVSFVVVYLMIYNVVTFMDFLITGHVLFQNEKDFCNAYRAYASLSAQEERLSVSREEVECFDAVAVSREIQNYMD